MEGQAQRRLLTQKSSRTRTRKPLSDCTNTISQYQSSQSSSATVAASKAKPKPKSNSKPTTTAAAATATDGAADPSTPLPPPRSSSRPGGDENSDVFEIRTVYSRKQTTEKRKGKEKMVAMPLSSYSAERVGNVGNREKRKEYEDMDLLEPRTVPLTKKQRSTRSKQDASDLALKDYIEQQKAYFAEIDAFELPEEEVESGNELD